MRSSCLRRQTSSRPVRSDPSHRERMLPVEFPVEFPVDRDGRCSTTCRAAIATVEQTGRTRRVGPDDIVPHGYVHVAADQSEWRRSSKLGWLNFPPGRLVDMTRSGVGCSRSWRPNTVCFDNSQTEEFGCYHILVQ